MIAHQSRPSKSLLNLAEMTSEAAALCKREGIPEDWLHAIPAKRARNLSVHGKVRNKSACFVVLQLHAMRRAERDSPIVRVIAITQIDWLSRRHAADPRGRC